MTNFEYNLFNQINIEADGNCLYRCVSYHLFGTQSFHNKIRNETYEYLKKNKTFVYEYCYLENNKFYIDIEIGVNKIKTKFFIEDYIENIKNDGFFGGFIELYIISKIYNTPIFIYNLIEKKGLDFYKKMMLYDNSEKIEYKFEEIIFLYYKNENHYIYLEPNIRLFKKNIIDFHNNEMVNNNLIVNDIQTGEN